MTSDHVGDYNADDDGSANGSNSLLNRTPANELTDLSSPFDYRPKSSGTIYGAGVALYDGPDIIGDTPAQWSMGAFDEAPPVVPPPSWAYREFLHGRRKGRRSFDAVGYMRKERLRRNF